MGVASKTNLEENERKLMQRCKYHTAIAKI